MKTMMTDLTGLLSKSLNAWDSNRDRSKQVEVGPSSLGGCRRQVWHTIKNTPETNSNTEKLAAILGTFIHAGVADAIKREDPFGDNFLIEQAFEHNGLKGHCDLFIIDEGIVVDWKTTSKKNLRYFPSEQQRWQVQVYGWLVSNNGYKVNQVALAAIPRDGTMADIKFHIENYDVTVAEQALNWLGEIEQLVKDGAPPPAPEKYAAYCNSYCKFYDPIGVAGCSGITK